MTSIDGIKGDMYQTSVVARYEILKNLRGKRIYIFFGLIALFLALSIALPVAMGTGFSDDPKVLISEYTSWTWMILAIGVPLFAAGALSSEFEERTALLMFTRPIKKESVFAGKFIAVFIISALGMAVYYAVAMILSLAVTGTVVPEAFASFGLTLLAILSAMGYCLMLSALFKRSTNATVLSIFSFILILDMVSTILMVAHIDPWFMLTYAAGSINQIIAQTPDQIGGFIDIVYPKTGISAAVMIVWCAVTSLIALILFKRREL